MLIYCMLLKNWLLVCLQHLYSAALFWADKVVSLSNEDPKDICTLAHCMYLMKQYHRAAHLIRNRGLEKVNYNFETFNNIITLLYTFFLITLILFYRQM